VRRASVVLRGVLIRGVVAASNVAALQAEPKMDPRITRGETLLAAIRSVRAMVSRATQMSALGLRHLVSLRYAAGR
jgi:hypothetical protein